MRQTPSFVLGFILAAFMAVVIGIAATPVAHAQVPPPIDSSLDGAPTNPCSYCSGSGKIDGSGNATSGSQGGNSGQQQTAATQYPDNLLGGLEGLITGNIGILIGFGLSFAGLWIWLMNQSWFGLVMVILGAAIPSAPGLFDSLVSGVKQAMPSSTTGK